MSMLGWDIGGANVKAAVIDADAAASDPRYRALSCPFEIQHDPRGLVSVLRRMAETLGGGELHAVTMTAELSRAFRTKHEGVGFVLDALAEALPGGEFWVYTVDGQFVSPDEARAIPLAVGAANWMATASLVARSVPACLLIDIGSTSTDIIPIVDGKVMATGRTDPERLLSGELIYTGAVRTPAEALVRQVPLWNGNARVAAEGFALVGDAQVWLGRLAPADYTAPTPDHRPATREFARERLARLVCADGDILDDTAIDAIARAIADAQISVVRDGIDQVRARHPVNQAVVTGLGDFIAAEAARAAGLSVRPLSDQLGPAAAQVAPAVAVALLLADASCRSSSSR